MSSGAARETWIIALAVLGLFVVQGLAAFVAGFFTGSGDLLRPVLVSVATYASGLVVIALVGARAVQGAASARLRLPPAGLGLGQRYAAVLALLALGEAMTALITLTGLGDVGTLGMLNALMASAGPLELVLAVLVLALLGGTAEELFFRGLLQPALVGWLGKWGGIIATSALFGLIHYDRIQSPAAMLMGLYFGWLAERSGSIRPGIAAHVVNNGLAVTLPVLTRMPWSDGIYVVELLLGPLIAAAAIAWLHRTLPPQKSEAPAA